MYTTKHDLPAVTRAASTLSKQDQETVTWLISDEECSAIKAAGSTDQPLVDSSLALAVTVFTNVFNRINDTAIDFPAVA